MKINEFEKDLAALRRVLLREVDIKRIYAEIEKTEAAEYIIEQNSLFVKKLAYAWKYNAEKYGVEMKDLIGAGVIALIMATRNYDPAKGSYYWYVGRYIHSYIQAEFYRHCNCSRVEGKRRHNKRELVNKVESLSEKIADNGEDEFLTLEDVIAHPEDKGVFHALETNNLVERLKKAGRKIHPKAASIIEMRFGIGARRSEKPLSLQKTAKALGMSKEGVRKIENKTHAYFSSISK